MATKQATTADPFERIKHLRLQRLAASAAITSELMDANAQLARAMTDLPLGLTDEARRHLRYAREYMRNADALLKAEVARESGVGSKP